METTRACPECGQPLPANVPRHLCPTCVLGAGPPTTERDAPAQRAVAGAALGRAAVDRAGFRAAAVELGLVGAEALDRAAAGTAGDATPLARELVRAGALTPYQAGALLQGKAKGLLIGEYLVLDKLGQGGMGVIFKARGKRDGRVVALKMLPPSFSRDHAAVQRFHREFEVASQLSHPNVVRAIDAAEDRGVQFLAMEYVPGHDLNDVVSTVGPLPIKLALHCAIQAARGLEAAHARGIVHRDVKPGNLMLDDAGNVRVLDLGLARVIEATSPLGRSDRGAETRAHVGSLTQTGTYMGTADFIAPEQAEDSKSADHRADVYSLGCTLYFLLTAHPPFEEDSLLKRLIAHQERPAPSLHAARDDVSPALEAVYQRMLAKRPDDRPQSMAEVAALLEACRSSAHEEAEARTTLRGFAETVLKRASPRKRGWGVEASIFARPAEVPGLFDPDLRLEDVVTDYHAASHVGPLTEDKLPPKPPRVRRSRGRSRRAPAVIAVGAAALLVAGLVVALWPRHDTPANGPALASRTNPVRPLANPAPEPPAAAPAKPAAVSGSFQPLFNGKDLTGWVMESSLLEDWWAEGGVLTFQDHGNPHERLLVTERPYGDFVLRLEYQPSERTDGGITLVKERADGTPRHYAEFNLGWDKDPNNNKTGDFWAWDEGKPPRMFPAKAGGWKGGGAWESLELERRGEKLRFKINGVTVNEQVDASTGPRRIALQGIFSTARFRNIAIRELGDAPATANDPMAHHDSGAPRLIYFDGFDNPGTLWPRGSTGPGERHDYREDHYRIDVSRDNWSAWLCPLHPLPEFACEVVARVVSDAPGSRGGLGLHVRSGPRGFQVRLTSDAQVFVEPSNLTLPYNATPRRVGPLTHPALKPSGQGFNRLGLRVQARRVEILADGARVGDPITLDWDPTPAHLDLGAFCESGSVHAEFDRIEIRALKPEPPEARALIAQGDALGRQGKPAAAAYREAVQLVPNALATHRKLLAAAKRAGDVAGAGAAWHEVLRITLDAGDGYADLSTYLLQNGRVDDALAVAREAVAIRGGRHPFYWPHLTLIEALLARNDEEGAVAAYRDAVRLDGPRIGDAIFALGDRLRRMGRYEEATKSYLHARKLALSNKQPAQAKHADREVEETRRWKALADRVPAIVRGGDRPADPGELLTVGTICAERRLYVGAARLFDGALKATPALANDRNGRYRYHAARYAALAGTRDGADDPRPDDTTKAQFRARALAWLQAELAACAKLLETSKPADRSEVAGRLKSWRSEYAFAEVRSPAALERRPETERAAWQALWQQVDALWLRATEER